MKDKMNVRFGLIALMVLVAAMSRLLPHPTNFTPIGGMALFGAAYFTKKYWAFLIPFLALWFSDLILNNVVYAAYQEGFTLFPTYAIWSYVAFGAIVLMGTQVIKKIKIPTLVGASFAASLIFFLLTNFGVWFADPMNMYPDTAAGLVAALAAGIPYFWGTLAGDLFYTAVMFGAFEMVKRQYPTLALDFN